MWYPIKDSNSNLHPVYCDVSFKAYKMLLIMKIADSEVLSLPC